MQAGSRFRKWVGLITIGCIACCALPLVAVVSFGSAFAALGAFLSGLGLEAIACLVIVGGAIALLVFEVLRRRKAKLSTASCESSCRATGDCCESEEDSKAHGTARNI